MIAIIIILLLMLAGSIYLFQAQAELRNRPAPPYIPGDSGTSTTVNLNSTTTVE